MSKNKKEKRFKLSKQMRDKYNNEYNSHINPKWTLRPGREVHYRYGMKRPEATLFKKLLIFFGLSSDNS